MIDNHDAAERINKGAVLIARWNCRRFVPCYNLIKGSSIVKASWQILLFFYGRVVVLDEILF
jgi:hypothetical protein